MHRKAILNRIQKHSSFVYGTIRLIEGTAAELVPHDPGRGRDREFERVTQSGLLIA